MSHRFDFLRPWPFSYYAKIAGLFFTLGAGMEFTYIQTGYCTIICALLSSLSLSLSLSSFLAFFMKSFSSRSSLYHLSAHAITDNTLIKGASKDQDFFKDLSKQMLQLHEENMRKKEESAKSPSGDAASSKR